MRRDGLGEENEPAPRALPSSDPAAALNERALGAAGIARDRVLTLSIVALSLAICWLGNGQASFWDRDEPRYAETARVMLEHGDFIVPYFNDQFRFQKPALTYWLAALAYQILGQGEFAARFFSGLAVAGTGALIAGLGNRMFGRPAGALAALMFALCPLTLGLGKLCLPDAFQLFFATGAFAALYAATAECVLDSKWTGAWFWFWISLGFAILTKGPVVPGMMAATMAAYRLMLGSRFRGFRLRWATGVPVLAAIAAPWFLAIAATAGRDFFEEALGRQVAGRAIESFDGKWLPPGYYLASLALGWGPWCAISLLATAQYWRRWREPGPVAFLFAWILGPMVLLECFKSKQMHYLAPCYPALALLAGGYVAAFCRETVRKRDRRQSAIAAASLALTGLLATGFFSVAWIGPGGGRVALACGGLIVLVGGSAASYFLKHGQLQSAVAIKTVVLATAAAIVGGIAIPSMERDRIIRPLADRIFQLEETLDLPVVMHQVIEPGLVYYSQRTIPMYFEIPDLLRHVAYTSRGVLTLLSQDQRERLEAAAPAQVEIIETWRGWVKMHSDVIYVARVKPAGENALTENASSRPIH